MFISGKMRLFVFWFVDVEICYVVLVFCGCVVIEVDGVVGGEDIREVGRVLLRFGEDKDCF